MRILTAFSLILMLGSPVFAQQPSPMTPSQIATQTHSMANGMARNILQLDEIISSWGPTLEAQQKQISDLQRDLAAVTKERDELKAKQEAK